MCSNPRKVLIDVGRVYDQHQVVFETIDEQVVDNPCTGVTHWAVANLADLETPNVVGQQPIDRLDCEWT